MVEVGIFADPWLAVTQEAFFPPGHAYLSAALACEYGEGSLSKNPEKHYPGDAAPLPGTWVPQMKRTELSPAPNFSRASTAARITSGWLESPR